MGKFSFFVVLAATLLAAVWLGRSLYLEEEHVDIIGGTPGERFYGVDDDEDKKKESKVIKFDLLDPESAPETMLTKILYGYHLMLETKQNAPEYAGNTITCNNCHFNGGNTLGGKNRGISLVGVTAVYPQFSKRDGKQISIRDRIANCFQRSLNGSTPSKDSLQMESLVAYLAWISHEVADAPMLPWLGLDELTSKHTPDEKNGKKIYYASCALCHGYQGEGTTGVPPLWGSDSFNDGAGMNTMKMLSSFVWLNMPYGQPVLTQEEALDVAAFIISRPRPHFNKK